MKLFSPKYPTKIGTWNVRTLYQSGKSLQTAKEMDRYSIEILGLREKTTIIQVYSPTNNADEEEKDDFYNSLQTTVNSVPKRDILMLLGDLNAKVGKDRTGREREMGPNGIGEMNENGEIFADFCAVNSLVICGTLFPHKNCHKITWVSPNEVTENQIDHIAISQRWRSSLQDVRNKRGADIASDHHLIIAKIQLKLLSTKKAKSRRKKFNVDLFKDP
ncbi:craniofacial development protein 2-like [Mytilus trossulus]|uniref:craniofacial development protein 2-like n=1 Tax=Mytilus trossulus TaxID=6551 RepID=UPI00300416BD